MDFDDAYLRVPRLTIEGASEEEKTELFWVGGAITELVSALGDFAAAVKLFEHADELITENMRRRMQIREQIRGSVGAERSRLFERMASEGKAGRPHGRWQFIAARDAVMTLSRFEEILLVLNAYQHRPVLKGRCKISDMKEARSVFSKQFPDMRKIRNALAHSGENYSDIDKIAIHAVDWSQRKGLIAGNLSENNHYELVYEGKNYSIGINNDSIKVLTLALDAVLRSFEPVAN